MLKIRLRRMGNRNRPFYRIVVSDSRRAPFSSTLEELGYYNPLGESPEIKMNRERIDHWVRSGAQMSTAIRKLYRQSQSAA